MEFVLIVILLSFSALFSGLTLGFLGLDKSELERKRKLGNLKAEAVYHVRENGNLLLVTLLIGNVLVNAILSIVLASYTTGTIAVIVSTFLIVVFGEILPQAFFTKYALEIGYRFVPIVRILMILTYPLSYPIAWMVEKIMGKEEDTIWSKEELALVIQDHESSTDSEIDSDEERLILGALTYSDKKAGEIMTPRTRCTMISEDTILTQSVLRNIKASGHTRIPVYQDRLRNVIGVLFTKDLITVYNKKPVGKVYRPQAIIETTTDTRLDDLLNQFIRQRIHIAYVLNNENAFSGLITLEDIVEEIIKIEIEDESDKK